MQIMILNAGLRVPSNSRLLADEISAALLRHAPQARVEVVDVREHAHAIIDAILTGFATGDLAEVLARLGTADAVVAVAPTFQASYSGLFKSFMDTIEPDTLQATPVLLAATGGSERHSLMLDHAMRPLFAYLGARPVATGIFAATSDFGTAGLNGRIQRATGELIQAAHVSAGGPDGATAHASPSQPGAAPVRAYEPRISRTAADLGQGPPDLDVVPFAELLGRYRG
ncbi:MAG: CE1759 family FMN reductase [Arachnia sp.]